MKFLLLVLCASVPAILMAQSDLGARKKFQEAEDFYVQKDYSRSLSSLNDAERLLGRKNPKIQYLKVLVYEKLALSDITLLQPALDEAQVFLDMGNQISENYRNHMPTVRAIKSTLPGDAQRAHQSRVAQQRELDAKSLRLGTFLGAGGKSRKGVEYGLAIGTRSSLTVLGLSTMSFKDINNDEDLALVSDWLKTMPEVKTTYAHVGYYHGFRILPKEKDWLRPMIGGRVVCEGIYKTVYTENPETVNNMVKAGVNPSDYLEGKIELKPRVRVDLVPGVMIYVKKMTIMAGMDVINTKTFQFAIAFQTY